VSQDFVSFARAHGVMIDSPPPIGVWRRYKTVDKPRHRNGAVKYLGDVGFVQNHATQDEVAVWHANGERSEAVMRELRSVRDAEMRRQRQAIEAMRTYFNGLLYLRGNHPYIERKGLNMAGCGKLKVDGDLLVVPMYRRPGPHLTSVQTITPDGQKKYRYGCPSRGCFLELVHRESVVTCLVEGFATGLAIFQNMPTAKVIVCFDAGNMVQVAREIRVSGLAVVAADNDHATEARTGTNPWPREGPPSRGSDRLWHRLPGRHCWLRLGRFTGRTWDRDRPAPHRGDARRAAREAAGVAMKGPPRA
jgi:putative DNA primase/helicase